MGSKLSSFSSSHENSPKRSESPVKQSERPPKRIKIDEKQLIAAKSDGIAVAVVVLNSGFLHWSNAQALGSTCRDTNMVWKQTRNTYLQPLLDVLESMVGWSCEAHGSEDFIVRSKLLDVNYAIFDTFHQCKEMVAAIHPMVHNVQNYQRNEFHRICLEDPSSCIANSECESLKWRMGDGEEIETDFLHTYHRRGTMAVTIALLWFAKSAMETDVDDYYFRNVFLGLPNAYFGGGSGFGHIMCSYITRAYPFRDQDLAKAARKIYPTASELEILGPLVPKVVLAEPLFRWVPPDGEKAPCSRTCPLLWRNLRTILFASREWDGG